MSTNKRTDVPMDYGYRPKPEISEGYQPSEDRGYKPVVDSNVKPDNPPKGGTSAQNNNNK